MSELDNSCKCKVVSGHLAAVKRLHRPRRYEPSPGHLALGDWRDSPYTWMHYVASNDGLIADDDVLISTDSRYWDIHDVQRYFLSACHCSQVLYTYQYPNLRMSTPFNNYLWRANAATKRFSNQFQKTLNVDVDVTLKKMELNQDQINRLIVSDQLINLESLDYFRRKSFLNSLLNILSFQDSLQLVSFENMRCKRLEGVRLVQQLACFNSESLKYLFLWDFVLPTENPLLINYSYITGSGLYYERPKTKHCFLRSLGQLKHLRVLAIEYSHIADGTGAALLSLLPMMKNTHFRLQLMCRESHIPGRTDAALGAGGHVIPDTAWRRVIVACPDLYVFMSFFRIRDYDNIRRFLTPSIGLREVHLQMGVDLKMRQRQDSDISCFVRHMAYYYGDTLVTLSIYQWRFAVFPLRRVLELMPRLVRFFYVGYVEDEVDLRRILTLISYGVCDRLKQVKIQIEDEESRRSYWQHLVDTLNEEFSGIMQLYNINFCLSIYKT